MSNRPTAILLGWLGCQPKNLRRFVQLYQNKGWDSIVRIASPESVIAAVVHGPSEQQHRLGLGLQACSANQRLICDKSAVPTKELQHQALDILHELQIRQCPRFIVHAFSNGGCLLWEWMRYYLFDNQQRVTFNNIEINMQQLRYGLVGRIFDSAPAYYGGRTDGLEMALQHVTPEAEKERLTNLAKRNDPAQVQIRHAEFWNNLCNDAIHNPELYLYSTSDELTHCKPLEELIKQRKERLGNGNVESHNFVDSVHCCHLLKYPEQYDKIVCQFLETCSVTGNVVGQSKNESAILSKL